MDIFMLNKTCHYGNMKLILKKIRKERGMTQQDLADCLDTTPVAISRFESGARRTNTEFLAKAANALGVSVGELFEKRQINVVGYIGAGAEFHAIDDHAKGAGLDSIDAPPGCSENAVAVKVRGTSMFPVYTEGDILVYSDRRTDIESFIKTRCIVGLSDGRILVKTITRGTTQPYWTLTSFNAAPIEDVTLEWCAKIEWVQPR